MTIPSDKPTSEPSLPATRSIDEIDRTLLALFEKRVREVMRDQTADPGRVVGRVAASAQRIGTLATEHASSDDLLSTSGKSEVLRHLASLCLQSIHELRVAYLGPKHSYSHLAAIKYFGDASALTPVSSIPAVFDAIERGDVASGIVPIENSTDGRVVDTLGMFVRREMQICGEVVMAIHHNLLSKTPRHEIVEVHSKPQALSQCRGWLAKNLPSARLVEISSSAAAAELASKKHGVAAVASIEAGREYDLDVIDASIEDNRHNVTRFAVLGKERPPRTGVDKTAILFQVAHKPGALADAMQVFKNHKLNLTWIESFPSPDAANEYLFFVELTGHRDDSGVIAAVDELTAQSQRLTVLGSYPKATL
ncbi:Prephenate dehydratase [Rubripirellula tenax]|uniref:prephenate dehydratase n=1 Tax=Rubripirellula tenax TaxID=2528015 RepID=A0A5C6EMJ1_9BACT|nr:prephenate dehydratase [Rubripirellula tenax]TWU48776.1 Prephenate dehydratase [Rubripirellula tenax]